MTNEPITIYVYLQPDGMVQVRTTDTEDKDHCIWILQQAIFALEDGTPVSVN